jgi:hypothetical protein
MSVRFNSVDRPSEDVTNACNLNPPDIVVDELCSLLDAADSASIADDSPSHAFEIRGETQTILRVHPDGFG